MHRPPGGAGQVPCPLMPASSLNGFTSFVFTHPLQLQKVVCGRQSRCQPRESAGAHHRSNPGWVWRSPREGKPQLHAPAPQLSARRQALADTAAACRVSWGSAIRRQHSVRVEEELPEHASHLEHDGRRQRSSRCAI